MLSVFGEGDYFGEMALLSDQPRSATMTVVGDAELLVLVKDTFERFLATNVNVMRQFVNLMSRRLAETSAMTIRDEEGDQKLVLGKSLVVFSPKGGIGKTSIAVNLATVLREHTNKSVVVFDCCYPFGDVGIMMNLEPKRTVVDLLPHINELSGEILESILQPHVSGVKVLLAPPTPEETELVTAEHVSIIVSALRELYEYIIVDTHSSFTDVSIGALDTADLILVLTTQELPALKNVRQFIDTATEKLGYSIDKMAIIVNRASLVGGLGLADVESTVGAKVVASISSAGPIAVSAANQGVPFVLNNKESQIYRDMYGLAQLIAPQSMEEKDFLSLDDDKAESRTLVQRVRQVPVRLLASATDGLTHLRAPDLLLGLGSLFAVSAPFLLILAIVGFFLRENVANAGLLNTLFNITIWVGILGGTFLVTRLKDPGRGSWVGGATYGLAMSFAAIAVLNIAAGQVGSFPLLLLGLIPYAILGIIGSLISERTRPQAQGLLG